MWFKSEIDGKECCFLTEPGRGWSRVSPVYRLSKNSCCPPSSPPEATPPLPTALPRGAPSGRKELLKLLELLSSLPGGPGRALSPDICCCREAGRGRLPGRPQKSGRVFSSSPHHSAARPQLGHPHLPTPDPTTLHTPPHITAYT